MKRLLKSMFVSGIVAGAILSIAVLSYAGDNKEGDKGFKGPDGSQRILRMKDKLGLTDDQVKKITVIFDVEKTGMKALLKQRGDDLKTLGEKVKTGAKDEELLPLITAVQTDNQNLMTEGKKDLDQVKEILTPTQQAKWILSMNNRWGHGKFNREKKKETDENKTL